MIDGTGDNDAAKDITENLDSDKMCNTENDDDEGEMNNDKNVIQTKDGKTASPKRSFRKRKKIEPEVEDETNDEPAGVR